MLKDSVCCIIFCHCCVCGIVIPRCSPSALCGVFRSICKNKLFSLKTGDFHEKNTIGADNLSEFRSYTGETGSKSLQRCLVARGNAHSTGIGCPHLGHRSEQLVCYGRSTCLPPHRVAPKWDNKIKKQENASTSAAIMLTLCQ